MDTAFNYDGNRIKARLGNGQDIDEPVGDPSPGQFMREAEHFSSCIIEDKTPKTPGEEGLRDMRLIEAIYGSAARAPWTELGEPPFIIQKE